MFELNLPPMERLRLALILAGVRAAYKRAPVWVEPVGSGDDVSFRLSEYLPIRGTRAAYRVSAHGQITRYPDGAVCGDVHDLRTGEGLPAGGWARPQSTPSPVPARPPRIKRARRKGTS